MQLVDGNRLYHQSATFDIPQVSDTSLLNTFRFMSVVLEIEKHYNQFLPASAMTSGSTTVIFFIHLLLIIIIIIVIIPGSC